MKKIKILTILYIVSLLFSTNSYAETGDIIVEEKNLSGSINIESLIDTNLEEKKVDIILEEELKKDGIELDSAIEEKEDLSILDKANVIKNKEVEKLMGKTDEEKNIEKINNVLNELEIKKELSINQLNEIQNNLTKLQKNIEDNNKNINLLKETKNGKEALKQIEKLENNNKELQLSLDKKQNLIESLESDLDSYSTTYEKYQLLLNDYVNIKNEKDKGILKGKTQKIIYLFISILIFTIIYIIKILLIRNEKFYKKHPNFGEYFDLLYGITIIIFIVMFIFYLFPELYALLIFISGSLIFINAQVISSFIASLILFRHFKIGDIIKIGTEKGKIIKMNPLNIIIKKINDYGVIENEELNIPNIDLLKEKVTLAKNSQIKENTFSIILSLKSDKDIFEIIDNIKDNIFQKMLTEKLITLNPLNNDTFKTKYEHIDQDKVKITFYWLGNSELNRKIEKKIIQYIKEYLYFEECNITTKCKSKNVKNSTDTSLQKVTIIEEETNS